jgi:hypothetical protein
MCRVGPESRLASFVVGVIVVLFAATACVAQPVYLEQGLNWTAAARADFYTRDQGSRMIPLAWLRALKQADGQPFLADSLARYGYLPNPDPTNRSRLPVGFTASGPTGVEVVGMTCAACHTREIKVDGKAYRIDGGPAIVDFQRFLTDLDTAVGEIVKNPAAFQPFAAAVLGTTNPNPADVADLRKDVDAWYLRYHTLMERALPKANPWGPARLDAVGMILNRLTGLDLGPPPSFLIPENIRVADAPVRYPFLWNAAVQDQTQWPGFADNGSDILALSRNLGEVLGVFATFEPKKDFLLVDFLNNNSANFDGLARLEDLIKLLGPPKWPWSVDIQLAAQGKAIYDRPTAQGGCGECHAIKPGKVRLPFQQTWATPIQNVGTDTREYDVLAWTAKTGVLQGAFIPVLTEPLEETDLAVNVLKLSVLGSIIEHVASGGGIPTAAARFAESDSDRREAIRDKLDAARRTFRCGAPAYRRRASAPRADTAGAAGAQAGPATPPAGPAGSRRRVPASREPAVAGGAKRGRCGGASKGSLRVARDGGHLGDRPVPAQRLGADTCRAAQAGRAAREVIQDRQQLRYREHRPRGRADAVQLHPDHHRLLRSQFRPEQLRPRIRHDAERRREEGAARVSEDAVTRKIRDAAHACRACSST